MHAATLHPPIFTMLTLSLALAAADKSYVLKAARIFDGKSDHVATPGLIVVVNGKIAGRRHAAPQSRPARRPSTWATPRCFPGFIDAHTHLTYPYERDYRNAELDGAEEEHPGAHAGRRGDCAHDADGGLHHRARRGCGRLHRRRPAQRDRQRQDSGTAHAGRGQRAGRDRRALRLLGGLRSHDLRPRERHHATA